MPDCFLARDLVLDFMLADCFFFVLLFFFLSRWEVFFFGLPALLGGVPCPLSCLICKGHLVGDSSQEHDDRVAPSGHRLARVNTRAGRCLGNNHNAKGRPSVVC